MLGAHGVLMDAYETDVRGSAGRPPGGAWVCRGTRCAAFAESGYAATVAAERVGGTQASWGA